MGVNKCVCVFFLKCQRIPLLPGDNGFVVAAPLIKLSTGFDIEAFFFSNRSVSTFNHADNFQTQSTYTTQLAIFKMADPLTFA